MSDIDDFSALGRQAALSKLEAAWIKPPREVAKEIPLVHLMELPEVFQMRYSIEPDEDHVEELRRIIVKQGRVDPIETVKLNSRYIVVDGHHRFTAYRAVGPEDRCVSIKVLDISPREAALRAVAANSRTVLTMSGTAERTEAAWKLVTLDDWTDWKYSKSEVSGAAGVSTETISKMRRVIRELTRAHTAVDIGSISWREARDTINGTLDTNPDFDGEDHKRRMEVLAKKTRKLWGPVVMRNATHVTDLLLTMLPRRAKDVCEGLKWHYDDAPDDF